MPYRVLEPYTYTEKNVPLIIFTWEWREGDDNELQLTHGASFSRKNEKKNLTAMLFSSMSSK